MTDLPQWAVDEAASLAAVAMENLLAMGDQPVEDRVVWLSEFLSRALADAAKPKWQPIETAPMPEVGAPGYGVRVLLAIDCGDGTLKSVVVGWWDGSGWDAQNLGYRVTHWMPLPAAPEVG